MFLTELVPAVLYGVLATTIPESPRYLMHLDRTDEARKILSGVLREGVEHRISEIRRTILLDHDTSLNDLKKPGGGLLPIVWIGIALSVFQQFVGINVIFYYSATLWQAVGFTEADALQQTAITSITNIVVTIVAIMLIDKIGRRQLLLIGSTGMTLSLGTMAWVFSQAPLVEQGGKMVPILTDTGGVVALLAANAFVVFFGMSWAPECGCCWVRCSTTGSVAPRSVWLPPRSGWRTS